MSEHWDPATGRISNTLSDMRCCNDVTLTHACKSLGLRATGTKHAKALRLVEEGLTYRAVQDRYGWRARQDTASGRRATGG